VSPPSFLFIRHGETDWNAEGRLQGQRDTSLNARGYRQAAEAGRRLASTLAALDRRADEALFVASPLERTRETMAGVRTALGLAPDGYALDDRLRELSFGAWEGLTWPEVKLRDPARYRQRRGDRWGFVPPGGESYAMLAERVGTWLATLDDRAVVVAHGGVARVLMVLVGGVTTLAAPETDVPQGRVFHFAKTGYAVL
jgi:probable phosphoglycerate mutase